jgi:hypothetical protein
LTACGLGIIQKLPIQAPVRTEAFGVYRNTDELFAENAQFWPYRPRNQRRDAGAP